MKTNLNTLTQDGYVLYEVIEEDEAMHRMAIEAFSEYIEIFSDSLLAPVEAASMLLAMTINSFRRHNKGLPKKEKWPVPTELIPHQIALLVLAYFNVRLMPWMDENEFPNGYLFVYQTDGPDKGTYSVGNGIWEYIEKFEPGIDLEKIGIVEEWLMEDAEIGERCVKDHLVAVNNGIFNCRTKALMPFSPEYIFLAKSPVDYMSASVNPVLHDEDDGTDWDVETWIDGLCADPALLWQTIKDAIMPHADRDTIATLYPEEGQGSCGRSSICGLMRGLCGDGNYSPRPLINNPVDIWVEPRNYALPSIVDEGELEEGSIEECLHKEYARAKKEFGRWRNPSDAFIHHGAAVQCVDRIPDQDSECFHGEILPIPLTGNFQGMERTYIKDDYIRRIEVLRYVLWKVLNM